MFQELEGHTAILVTKGVYQQVPVYVRDNGALFAKVGSGFVRLNATGSTSKATTRIDFLAVDQPMFRNAHGQLFVSDGQGRKPVELEQTQILQLEQS